MGGRARRCALALGLLCLPGMLVACRGGGKGKAAPAPTAAATAPGARCTAPAPTDAPESARTSSSTGTGDFDGDGRPDRLVTFRVGAGGPWHVRMELAAGGGDEQSLPSGAEGVRALGGVRLDVGPADAALAVVGTSAAGTNVGVFVAQGCRLVRVTLNGAPAELPVRSSAAARDGVVCQPPGLVAYSATSTDGQTFRGTSVAYLLVGSILDETHRATQTVAAGDPDFPRYGAFSYGTLKLG